MCTCLNLEGYYNYFGRNMDITHSFNEKIIIIPRNYILKFKKIKNLNNHYAIIGIGTLVDDYPLYAEASNEKGISIAGLSFPNNCHYYKYDPNKINLAPFELPLYLLGKCKNMKEVLNELKNINIINQNFSKDIMLTPLHFMVSYKNKSIVIETLKDGMKIFDNPYNILTNNPTFFYHKENIINYINLNNKDAINNLNPAINFTPNSYGQGAIGLPGDYSSSSRFIRCFFNKSYLKINDNELENIIQFFKCLESVSMINGCVLTNYGYEYTRYTSCINTTKGILYYKTYSNPQIYSLSLDKENLESTNIITYSFNYNFKIENQN